MIGIVLLAAGQGSRFGSAKQLALIDGEPMILRAARTLAGLNLPMQIVIGAHHERIEPVLDGYAYVYHADWASGMGSSIACGVRALLAARANLSGLLIALADQPWIDKDDLMQLVDMHAKHPDRIIVSRHADADGPPCLFPAHRFAALLALHGEQGARSVWKAQASQVMAVAMPHAARDVDTPDDLSSSA